MQMQLSQGSGLDLQLRSQLFCSSVTSFTSLNCSKSELSIWGWENGEKGSKADRTSLGHLLPAKRWSGVQIDYRSFFSGICGLITGLSLSQVRLPSPSHEKGSWSQIRRCIFQSPFPVPWWLPVPERGIPSFMTKERPPHLTPSHSFPMVWEGSHSAGNCPGKKRLSESLVGVSELQTQ